MVNAIGRPCLGTVRGNAMLVAIAALTYWSHRRLRGEPRTTHTSSETRPSSTSSSARKRIRYVSDQADKRGGKNNQTAIDERITSDDERMQTTVVPPVTHHPSTFVHPSPFTGVCLFSSVQVCELGHWFVVFLTLIRPSNPSFCFIRTFNTHSPALYLPTYTNLHPSPPGDVQYSSPNTTTRVRNPSFGFAAPDFPALHVHVRETLRGRVPTGLRRWKLDYAGRGWSIV